MPFSCADIDEFTDEVLYKLKYANTRSAVQFRFILEIFMSLFRSIRFALESKLNFK